MLSETRRRIAAGDKTVVPVDLILLDLVMPGMDGKAVLMRLKDDPEVCMRVFVRARAAAALSSLEVAATTATSTCSCPSTPPPPPPPPPPPCDVCLLSCDCSGRRSL